MKTFIIAPQFVDKVGDYHNFPLGLAYISAVLKEAGFDVSTLNLNYVEQREYVERIQTEIDAKGIDIVCCGGLSAHYHSIKAVVDAARGARREVKIVLGGGIISSEPELMIDALGADIGVIGEGEITSVDLFETLARSGDLAGVPGIIYRDEVGRITRNKPRPYIDDLDMSPIPDYEGFDVGRYLDMQQTGDFFHLNKFDNPRLLPMILSRSCPYNCTFCYHPLGTKYRRRSLDKFFTELEFLVEKYEVNILAVLDELFSLDKEVMAEFCERMKKFDIMWTAQFRVDRVDRETLAMLRDSGLFYISYGIESASDVVLKSMRKHITIKQIENALAITRELGIGIQGNFIMGDPAETVETANETISWWKENYHYHINFAALIPFPGSVVYKQSVERGLIPDRRKFIEAGCPSLNMTVLDDSTYSSVFDNVRSAQNDFKQFCRDIVVTESQFDPIKKIQLYRLEMTCPHCDARNVYNNYSHPRLEMFKLVCRNCNQRSDISSTCLPSIRKPFEPLLDLFDDIIRERRTVSLTPVSSERMLKEALSALGVHWRLLNYRYVLDFDKSREKELFMGLPIFHRTKENLNVLCGQDHILVLPCTRPKMVLQDLHDNDVVFSRVIYLGSTLGQDGLVRPCTGVELLRTLNNES